MNMVSEYFDIMEKYMCENGEKTVVVMQVGSFYEMYGVDNEKEKLGNVAELSSLLNIVLTKRNKKIQHNDRSNPLMIGFPCVAISKYIPLLLESDYTIILVDQVKNGNSISRQISQIISPSTYIESSEDEYLVLLYIENFYDQLHIGASAVNIITGKSIVCEYHSKKTDMQLPLDETLSFLQQYKPKETILCYRRELKNEITEYFSSIAFTRLIYKIVDKCTSELPYQEAVLSNLFPNDTMLSVIELINMEKLPFAVTSYVLIIEFLYSHNPMLIKRMMHPIVHTANNTLSLASNTIEQLDIVSTRKSKRGISCLFDVLNYCSTPGGKRLLKERLLSPVSNTKEIERRLNLVKMFGDIIGDNRELNSTLSRVGDIDRLKRKVSICSIKPEELAKLCDSCLTILDVSRLLNKLSKLSLQILDSKNTKSIESLISECNNTLDISSLCNGNIVFRLNIIREFDDISEKINKKLKVIKYVAESVSQKIGDVKIEYSPTTGYYIGVSTYKAKKLNDKDNKLFIQHGKSSAKITSLSINDANRDIIWLKDSLKKCVDKYFHKFVDNIHTKYSNILAEAASAISELDVVKSLYIASIKNSYCRPTISPSESGFFRAKGLRHPIIEKINTNVKYVPNNIDISDTSNGIVLYSINAGGKTSLLKACGLCVILAQIGSYVPASSFEFYPFNKLSTRIISENSVLYGKSSFVSEMQDLRGILQRSDKDTLVLADEITNGTEHTSGSAIFASSVITLAKRGTKFIFTTHLHNIYPFIERIPNVSIFHLSMTISEKDVVFNHKLCKGPGSSMYGLEVCESLDMDKDFLNTAFIIRNQIDCTEPTAGRQIKKSRYNRKKIVQSCQVCGYCPKVDTDIPLDVHHIYSQCLSDNNGMINNIHKDVLCNLVVLCKSCHKKAHNNEINIGGYFHTTKGIKLKIFYK